jgi:hypothetical protein
MDVMTVISPDLFEARASSEGLVENGLLRGFM